MSFTRYLLATLLVPIVVLSTTPARAQVPPLACTAVAAPQQVRQEGYTELVGDILLTCTGGLPTTIGSMIPQANVTLSLNTLATSRLLGNAAQASEGLFLVEEPGNTANPVRFPCLTPLSGCPMQKTSGGNQYRGSAGRYNVFQAVQGGPNQLVWFGVPIDPPGTTGSRVMRITNVRANANLIGTGPGGQPGPLLANVSISGPMNASVSPPQVTVGAVRKGLNFSVISPQRLPQGFNVNMTLINSCVAP